MLSINNIFQYNSLDLNVVFGRELDSAESISSLYSDIRRLDGSIMSLWKDYFQKNEPRPLERIHFNVQQLQNKATLLQERLKQKVEEDPTQNINKASIAIEIACREMIYIQNQIQFTQSQLKEVNEKQQKAGIHTLAGTLAALEVAKNTVKASLPLTGIQITHQLRDFNIKLREIEAQYLTLENCLKNARDKNLPIVKDLENIRTNLQSEFSRVQHQKANYVKVTYPENPVYAMANPRTLEKDIIVYSAGTSKKMDKMLYSNGFHWSNLAPATGYGLNFVQGGWGANEMGEKGYYFNIQDQGTDPAPYLGAVGQGKIINPQGEEEIIEFTYTNALKCKVEDPMHGASILPISELHTTFGFTKDQIERGYKGLHANYPFIQNDGLPPKDTEIVFLKAQNKLKPTGVLTYDPLTERTIEQTLNEYIAHKVMNNADGKIASLHPTWG